MLHRIVQPLQQFACEPFLNALLTGADHAFGHLGMASSLNVRMLPAGVHHHGAHSVSPCAVRPFTGQRRAAVRLACCGSRTRTAERAARPARS